MTQVTSGAFTVAISTDIYAAMASGVWVELPKTGGYAPPHGIFAFSGTAWDQTRQRIICFGGGDKDYWGNDVWHYDTTAQAFVQHYAPDDMRESVGIATLVAGIDPTRPGLWSPSGRPYSRHTGNSSVYVAHRGDEGEFLMGGGGSYYSGNNGYVCIGSPGTLGSEQLPPGVSWTGPAPTNNGVTLVFPGDLWHYDISTKAWVYKGSCRLNGGTTFNSGTGYYDPNGPIQSLGSTVYDSVQQVVWGITSIEARYYGYTEPAQYAERYHTRWSRYNPDTGVFTNYAMTSIWNEYLDITPIAFDAARGKVYLFAVDAQSSPKTLKFSSFDTTSHTWTNDIATQGTAPTVHADSTVVYASGPDKICYINPLGMWGLSLATNPPTWSRLCDTFTDSYGSNMFQGKGHYDSSRNMLFMCVGRNSAARAYGYKF